MKRFYASCGVLVVGILLVGPVHAGPRHSSPRSGRRSQHSSGQHRRVVRPWLLQLPWQWVPEHSPNFAGYDPGYGGYDPNIEPDDPNAGVSDPNCAVDQSGGNLVGPSFARSAVTPKGGSQQRLSKFSKGSRRTPGSRPGRR
jgi:hypothetical protein